MALTLLKQEITPIPGPNGGYLVTGSFTWTSTNTTGTLPYAFGHIIGGVSFNLLGAPTAAETHYIDNSGSIVNTVTGYTAVPATGLPIGRVGASVTSALVVGFSYFGR